jgi:DNA glycosylase AlkZ-like
MNLHDVARMRLVSQQIARRRHGSAHEVVSALGAMQAQDYEMALWAIGLRLLGPSAESIRAAADRGEIIRTHVLRPTWHFVPAEDLLWMLELTAPHVIASLRSRHRQMGLTERVFAKSGSLLKRALQGRAHLMREELLAILGKGRMSVEGNRGWHLLLRAELDGVICSGPSRSGKQTYALIAERVRSLRRLSREDALATLARRYFTTRSPATLQDFIWWSGLPAADARAALEMVQRDFTRAIVGRTTYWLPGHRPSSPGRKASVHVLPAYDEFLISYRDRSAALAGGRRSTPVSANGVFYPVIVVDGEVTGTWKRTSEESRIRVTLFGRCSRKTARSVERAFGRYGRFRGIRMVVDLRRTRR